MKIVQEEIFGPVVSITEADGVRSAIEMVNHSEFGLSASIFTRDLGASAIGAVRRIILPMLFPAILVSAILVFADVLDDFVIVRYLSSDASTETTSMRIYQTARAAPTPALNAMATIILVVSALVIVMGWLAYRRWTRRQGENTDIGTFANTL